MGKTISYQNFYKKTPKEFTKEDAKILVEKPEIPCDVRGETLLDTAEYIKMKYNKDGLKRFKQELQNLGYSIDFKKIQRLGWYPLGLRVLYIIAAARVFRWENKDIIELGWNAAKLSLIVKFFFKYFLSKEVAWKKASEYWKKHYSTGRLTPIEFNDKEKYCTIRVYDTKIHPIYCIYYLGYFRRIAAYTFGETVTCQETKCMYKGHPYHEFLFRWL